MSSANTKIKKMFVINKNKSFLVTLVLINSFVTSKCFEVYWNIPSFMCKKFGFTFENVEREYGIIQNAQDKFRGEKVTILYDPGNFPALLQNSSSGQYFRRNGGVPQEGSLSQHLKTYQQHLNELIPNKDYDGLAIIDFESWRPIFRQNFGSLKPYKDVSIEIERNKHWFWSKKQLEDEAARRWEDAGREFMEETIRMSKDVRPYASWGYYTFPYCFNNDGSANCAANVQKENNQITWLFKSSDIIYPSVYLSENLPQRNRAGLVRGRVRESLRLSNRVSHQPKTLTYIRYVYTDTRNLLTESDLLTALQTMRSERSDGVILWGSSNDLNSRSKCADFSYYLENTLGPVVQSFMPRYAVGDIQMNDSVLSLV